MQCLFQRKFPDVQCVVTLITEKVVEIVLPGNEKGVVLLNQSICAAGVTEDEFFSLQYMDRHKKWQWIRSHKPLYPQWKDSIADRHSVTVTSIPVFNLRLVVKFYPNDPCRVPDVLSRYNLFLQVRNDMASHRLTMPEDMFVELCGMILQSDIGDTPVPDLMKIDVRLAMSLTPALRQRIFQAHSVMRGREPDAVEYMFLDKVKWLDGYGSIATDVFDDKRNPCLFCLKPTSVYVEKNGRKFINVFWPSVTGFAVRKTALVMKVKDKNISMHCFYLPSKEEARNLWKLCEEHHAFFRKNFEIRLMRSSSSAASVTRHVVRPSSNYDEESRLTMNRSSGSRKGFSETNDSNSIISAALTNGQNSSANTSPAMRRSSVVSDRGLASRASDHELLSSPVMTNRMRAVHLSDVESDSYVSHRTRPYLEISNSQAASDLRHHPRGPSSTMTAPAYEAPRNGLSGSIHSLQSDPTGGPQSRKARRRRSRPNSPPGKAGPPPELLDHIMFEPIEPPADLSEAQRRDIAYTVVQTNAEPFRVRYSPRMKQRGRSWLKPAPPPTEILPHASAPVTDGQSDLGIPPVTSNAAACAPQRPLPSRPNAYTSRSVLSPVEAINRYANTLRAKQKDLLVRGTMYNSPKPSLRHQQSHHHPKDPHFSYMATGPDVTPQKTLHNASYSAAIHNPSYPQTPILPETSPQQNGMVWTAPHHAPNWIVNVPRKYPSSHEVYRGGNRNGPGIPSQRMTLL